MNLAKPGDQMPARPHRSWEKEIRLEEVVATPNIGDLVASRARSSSNVSVASPQLGLSEAAPDCRGRRPRTSISREVSKMRIANDAPLPSPTYSSSTTFDRQQQLHPRLNAPHDLDRLPHPFFPASSSSSHPVFDAYHSTPHLHSPSHFPVLEEHQRYHSWDLPAPPSGIASPPSACEPFVEPLPLIYRPPSRPRFHHSISHPALSAARPDPLTYASSFVEGNPLQYPPTPDVSVHYSHELEYSTLELERAANFGYFPLPLADLQHARSGAAQGSQAVAAVGRAEQWSVIGNGVRGERTEQFTSGVW
jgi:hypothetical protein